MKFISYFNEILIPLSFYTVLLSQHYCAVKPINIKKYVSKSWLTFYVRKKRQVALLFYKYRVNLGQIQICLGQFKFEPQSILRRCLCLGLCFCLTDFNLGVYPVNLHLNLKSRITTFQTFNEGLNLHQNILKCLKEIPPDY